MARSSPGVTTIDFHYPAFRHSVQVVAPSGTLSNFILTSEGTIVGVAANSFTLPFLLHLVSFSKTLIISLPRITTQSDKGKKAEWLP